MNFTMNMQKGETKTMTERETRKYEITAEPEQLNVLEALFKTMESMGILGSSRKIVLMVDGDGAFHPRITVNGEKIPKDVYETDFGYGIVSNQCTLYDYTGKQDDFTYRDETFRIFYDFG